MTTTLDGTEVEAGGSQRPDADPPRAQWRIASLVRGRPTDPVWARPALLALLVATAVLYMWGLGGGGWANAFYAAAVQAGTKSWKAFFFGSFDASNLITVDKPPASLWVMELSARLFGLNSWSLLVPEALEGVVTVAILYATVKRWFGYVAGLLAGLVVTVTPVAASMFRYDNPDALLVLLLTAGAYAMTRALEDGRTRWLIVAMSLVGTGFITKMLQAFLVLPAFALVYLLAGPPRLGRRIWQLALSGVALVISAGWWVAVVELTPKTDRPYVGGSTDDNLLNLIFGYNGFGRVTGSETGSTASQWGPTGWDRLFLPTFGSQISWLIPGALVVLAAALWLTRREPRASRTRAAMVLWGGWLIVTGLLLSYAKGIIHPYYTVALAPAVGAVVGVGLTAAWKLRHTWIGRGTLAAALGATSIWAFVLLGRSSTWMPEIRILVLSIGMATAAAILIFPLRRQVGGAVAVTALVVALAGPSAYALDTAATPESGSIPSAGPTQSGGFGTGAAVGGFTGRAGIGRTFAGGGQPGGFGGTGAGAATVGGTGGTGGFAPARGGALGGAGGGLLNAGTPSAALTKLLQADASRYLWVLAIVGSNDAAGYQLSSGDPVMAIGGFNGTDPAPTLAGFQADVAAGKIHYFIASSGGGLGGSATSTASSITSWVESRYAATTVDGVTLYDLSPST